MTITPVVLGIATLGTREETPDWDCATDATGSIAIRKGIMNFIGWPRFSLVRFLGWSFIVVLSCEFTAFFPPCLADDTQNDGERGDEQGNDHGSASFSVLRTITDPSTGWRAVQSASSSARCGVGGTGCSSALS